MSYLPFIAIAAAYGGALGIFSVSAALFLPLILFDFLHAGRQPTARRSPMRQPTLNGRTLKLLLQYQPPIVSLAEPAEAIPVAPEPDAVAQPLRRAA